MIPDLLQAFQIIPKFHVKGIRCNLGKLAILIILLSVQKPIWDFELARISHNHHQAVKLGSRKLTSPTGDRADEQI